MINEKRKEFIVRLELYRFIFVQEKAHAHTVVTRRRHKNKKIFICQKIVLNYLYDLDCRLLMLVLNPKKHIYLYENQTNN